MIRRSEGSIARERRNEQIAQGIFGLGVLAAVIFIARALLAKKKTRIGGPIFSFIIIPLAVILLVSCLRSILKRRFNRLES
ncbi:MAG TPA: hypothetical protein VK785_09465 [Opitutaceae bacterium]|nr:hypothetical protein [Opitutaceae bacterium]